MANLVEAWILPAAAGTSLERRRIALPPLADDGVLVEPLIGSWEANMTHAVRRSPLDVCRKRREPYVVLGNCGVVRVLQCGAGVRAVAPGDLCMVLGFADVDARGYTNRVYGYDAPNTVGLLAKQTILLEGQLYPLPRDSRHTIRQWAAFAVRYLTAWANWKVALACWRALRRDAAAAPKVCAWGGGVSYAELTLARQQGFETFMLASHPRRLAQLEGAGIVGIDRRPFDTLAFDETRYCSDPAFRARYEAAERAFLQTLHARMGGEVDIFIDHLGGAVWRATLLALARPGVVATSGWKSGATLPLCRPMECFQWHVHVHTHFVNMCEVREAVDYAEREGWVPPDEAHIYPWTDVPELAQAYEHGACESYFPLYAVNAPP